MAAVMLGLSMMERVGWLSGRNIIWPLLIVGAGFAGAGVLLLVMTGIRLWRDLSMPGAPALFAAGLSVAYLLLPLAHHLIGTDGYYYITDKDNFFSWNWLLQGVVWLVTGGMAVGVTRLRGYLVRRRERGKR